LITHKKWWLASAGALLLAAAVGIGAVMAQESPTPDATTTQETPAAQETPTAEDTPNATPDDGGAEDGTDDGDEPRQHGGCAGVKGVAPEEMAAFLGISEEQLRTELAADGASLASVAAAHGQSRAALIGFLTSELEAALAEKVAAGDLTQAEADEKLAEFSANVDEKIDASPAFGRGFHGGNGDDSDDSGTSSGAFFRGGTRT
jgi:hypothetical protein